MTRPGKREPIGGSSRRSRDAWVDRSISTSTRRTKSSKNYEELLEAAMPTTTALPGKKLSKTTVSSGPVQPKITREHRAYLKSAFTTRTEKPGFTHSNTRHPKKFLTKNSR